jgi:hypothetical protein
MPLRPHSPTLLLCLLMPLAGHGADNCEALRTQIEQKILAAGVASFSLSVVDAAASAPGRTVGSCAKGTRRIVYDNHGATGTVTPRVITECSDGSAPADGVCRRANS